MVNDFGLEFVLSKEPKKPGQGQPGQKGLKFHLIGI